MLNSLFSRNSAKKMEIPGETIFTFVKCSCAKFKYLSYSANWWKQIISSASITEDIFVSSIDPISWMVWCHASLLKWSCSLWSTEKAKRSIYTASGGESEAARGRQRKRSRLRFNTDPSENKHSLHYCHFKSSLSGGSWETFLSAVLLSVLCSRHICSSLASLHCLLIVYPSQISSLTHFLWSSPATPSSNALHCGSAELSFTFISGEIWHHCSPH